MFGKKHQKNEEKKEAKSSRFNFNFDDDDFEELSRKYIPLSTAADTAGCIKLFNPPTLICIKIDTLLLIFLAQTTQCSHTCLVPFES